MIRVESLIEGADKVGLKLMLTKEGRLNLSGDAEPPQELIQIVRENKYTIRAYLIAQSGLVDGEKLGESLIWLQGHRDKRIDPHPSCIALFYLLVRSNRFPITADSTDREKLKWTRLDEYNKHGNLDWRDWHDMLVNDHVGELQC